MYSRKWELSDITIKGHPKNNFYIPTNCSISQKRYIFLKIRRAVSDNCTLIWPKIELGIDSCFKCDFFYFNGIYMAKLY